MTRWPKGLPWGLLEVVLTVEQVHCSRRRLLRRGLEFHVCTINKSAHTKKVWQLIVCTSIDWFIDFNAMSNHHVLLYALWFGNRIHYTYTLKIFVLFLKIYFTHGSIEYELFKKKSIWPIDESLIGTTTTGQSGPGSNGNEVVLYIPQVFKTRTLPPDAAQYHTHDTPIFCWRLTPAAVVTFNVFYALSTGHFCSCLCICDRDNQY